MLLTIPMLEYMLWLAIGVLVGFAIRDIKDAFYFRHRFSEVMAVQAETLDLIVTNQEAIMINTAQILAEVAREHTELASWKALSAAKDKVISDQAAALAAAIAANDPAAIAKVQADLDQAATALKNDNDDAAAAVAGGMPAATPPTDPTTPPA